MINKPRQTVSDEKIIKDLEKWAQQFTNPEKIIIPWDDNKSYTLLEILDALKTKTDLGKDFLKMYRSLSEKIGIEPIELIKHVYATN